MTACPGSDMEPHTYQEAQTISRVRGGMMKTYFVLWDSKITVWGSWGEENREVGERFWCASVRAMSMNCEWASVWAEHLHNNLAERETERGALGFVKTSCRLVHIKGWGLLANDYGVHIKVICKLLSVVTSYHPLEILEHLKSLILYSFFLFFF